MSPRKVMFGLRALIASAGHSRETVEAYQLACLRSLVDHAYRRVPYYRQLLRSVGFKPGDLRTLADFSKIPATSRSDIQFLPPSEICAEGLDHASLRKTMTSGSTGSPLVVRRTAAEEKLLLALRIRTYADFRQGLFFRRGVVDHLDPATAASRSNKPIWTRLGIYPRLLLDWRTPKDEIVASLARFRPHVVTGPPAILAALADELTSADREAIGPQAVVSRGETLSPDVRRRIEDGFGVPVIERYGSHETVFIAGQPRGRDDYQVCAETAYVEVLRDGNPVRTGESGEVILTALHSYAMPFIRYRQGDEVVLGEPVDGRLTFQSIKGRTIDRFVLPSGKRVHGYTLGEAIETSGLEVVRFQVTQQRRDFFSVQLELRSDAPAALGAISEELQRRLEPGVEVRVAQTEIPMTGSKFYPFVSLERLEGWNRD